MYPPDHYRQNDFDTLMAFIKQYHFASVTAFAEGQYHVAHIPIVIKEVGGEQQLFGHFASDNPIITAARQGTELSLVFNGPHCYVSSTWYDAKQASTWNYMMATMQARPEVLPASALPGLLNELISQEEGTNPAPRYEELPENYTSALLPHITGVRFHIQSLRGVFKLSQNKTAKQRQLIIARLQERGDADGLAIAEWMQQY